ncbi:Transcriptional coactivator p15 (PC4) family protein (KELP) [Heracleum sosnowskyi]|uniref:Transcriptional coactivator p15 (PC4) family protein (KELP) n=1 Tax=Heracleum sosnowskyi TaxID=360622 RepID=A0AAD8IBT9_9APIA|nr:Transcriptional coactivator p15 (PC4) family protein (KELP) [Heracleum sosnowskyi]
MSTAFFFSLTVPPGQYQLHHHSIRSRSFTTTTWSHKSLTYKCSSAPSSPPSTSVDESVSKSEPDPVSPLSGCKACGKEEIESGCNGEGRIQGGIATVPGFGWWPIKAYRPCPGFVASGGRYMRQGQSMDEVAGFGRVETAVEKTVPLVKNVDEPPPSKKKKRSKKVKK